jgi:hypothetical protein
VVTLLRHPRVSRSESELKEASDAVPWHVDAFEVVSPNVVYT